MEFIRRPLAVAALSTTFALAGVASAFACDGAGGSQPGSYDGAGSYDGSTTAAAARRANARKHGKPHARRAA
jgi:hypothetical protein